MTRLIEVRGIGPRTAELLGKHGVGSAAELAAATPEGLARIEGIGLARAAQLIAAALLTLEQLMPPTVSGGAGPAGDAVSDGPGPKAASKSPKAGKKAKAAKSDKPGKTKKKKKDAKKANKTKPVKKKAKAGKKSKKK